MPPNFDPITLEIFWSRLTAIADQSAKTLVRTSFSTIVRESNDYATALMDADGALLAENTIGIPSFLGIMPRTLRELLKRFPKETWQPGDCVITNDPWLATGHLPDVTMIMPIFHRDALVGFGGSIAHSPDMGGAGWTSDAREVFEEGLRIPPCRFMQAGKPNADVHDFILGNVRVPDQVLGDLRAQVSAADVCARELRVFLDDLGDVDLRALSAVLQDRAEGAMRRAIEAVPDGIYRSSVEGDGFDDMRTHIECAVTIEGSTLTVDYAGTSPQIDRGLNTVMNYTYAYSVYPIKCALDPLTRRNDGSYRPITITAPEGCILNPTYPAPCNARQLTGHLLAGAIYKALAPVIPEQILAESGSAPGLSAVFAGRDRNASRVSQILFARGGMGAGAHGDGHDCTPFPTNAGAGSIEAFEGLAPLIVWRKELCPDSGGAGKYRGGMGQEIEIEIVSPRTDAPVHALGPPALPRPGFSRRQARRPPDHDAA